ncbi:hypothetical protein M670_01451 [Schinkia azotoformans MEV2011]|uniref:Uncharacterized protein n=2 Tax=Schinkia azotoformans TaxID=1454 RepID=A0A072P0P2_SCHAZ|nr:hypothetical protein M670_01451 [Schinkia azotoformans MEV2011]
MHKLKVKIMKILKYIILLIFLVVVAGCNNQSGSTATAEQNKSMSEKTSVTTAKQNENQNESGQIYASVGGKKIAQEEMDYECFRAQLQNALSNKPKDDTCPPEQTLISQIVELRAVDYLADLKGVSATEEEVQQRMKAIKQELSSSATFKEMIASFGEEKFWNYEKQRYFTIINSEKVKQKLVEEEKEKYNDQKDDATLKYNAKKEFDDLLVEAVGMIDTTIFYH